jgi:hypothetical protein
LRHKHNSHISMQLKPSCWSLHISPRNPIDTTLREQYFLKGMKSSYTSWKTSKHFLDKEYVEEFCYLVSKFTMFSFRWN